MDLMMYTAIDGNNLKVNFEMKLDKNPYNTSYLQI